VETHRDMNNLNEPVMRYYLGAELNSDKTNYWAPFQAARRIMRSLSLSAMVSILTILQSRTAFTVPISVRSDVPAFLDDAD
jgi:hypothetical protein